MVEVDDDDEVEDEVEVEKEEVVGDDDDDDDDDELLVSLKPPTVADREVEEGEAGVTLKNSEVFSKPSRVEEVSLSARLYNTDE